MGQRVELQTLLEGITAHVYFQPPENLAVANPCIVYQRDFAKTEFADNLPYSFKKRYMVTVIDRDPESSIPDQVAKLPTCTFNRFFVADGLNHDVFQLYF